MYNENSCVMAAVNPNDELERIAKRARSLAQSLNLPLIFVHVVDDDALFDYANSFSLSGLVSGEYELIEAKKEIMVRKLLEDQLKTESHPYESLEIHSGKRTETIANLATERHAVIIVLGQPESHFGSVATHLARHTPCDLYIVRLTA